MENQLKSPLELLTVHVDMECHVRTTFECHARITNTSFDIEISNCFIAFDTMMPLTPESHVAV